MQGSWLYDGTRPEGGRFRDLCRAACAEGGVLRRCNRARHQPTGAPLQALNRVRFYTGILFTDTAPGCARRYPMSTMRSLLLGPAILCLGAAGSAQGEVSARNDGPAREMSRNMAPEAHDTDARPMPVQAWLQESLRGRPARSGVERDYPAEPDAEDHGNPWKSQQPSKTQRGQRYPETDEDPQGDRAPFLDRPQAPRGQRYPDERMQGRQGAPGWGRQQEQPAAQRGRDYPQERSAGQGGQGRYPGDSGTRGGPRYPEERSQGQQRESERDRWYAGPAQESGSGPAGGYPGMPRGQRYPEERSERRPGQEQWQGRPEQRLRDPEYPQRSREGRPGAGQYRDPSGTPRGQRYPLERRDRQSGRAPVPPQERPDMQRDRGYRQGPAQRQPGWMQPQDLAPPGPQRTPRDRDARPPGEEMPAPPYPGSREGPAFGGTQSPRSPVSPDPYAPDNRSPYN